jgi:SpoVK/Ycf46/Vps4 family AAA+-type ATPase
MSDDYASLEATLRPETVPVLYNYLTRTEDQSTLRCNVVRIGGPDAAEMRRIVHYARLTERVRVDWRDLERMVPWMAVEGIPARTWLARLEATGRVDRETARSRVWLSSMPADDRSPWEMLDALVGLDPVKEHIKRLVARGAMQQIQAKDRSTAPRLHMVFSGNPGTGKTTVARLIGEIYRDMGLLRRGHLVEASGADLVAGYVGQTAMKTHALVDRALDGVLFIDEAYDLVETNEAGFNREALNALVVRLDNDRHRLAVVAAGYPRNMEAFLKENPGLSRRFPAANRITFPDFSPEELLEILQLKLHQHRLEPSDEAWSALSEIVEGMHATRDEGFGNAGAMENLADALYSEWAYRVHSDTVARDEPLIEEDIPASYLEYAAPEVPEVDELMAELNALVGLDEVKEFVHQQLSLLKYNMRREEQGQVTERQTLHMVFAGNPGTGKTTVAELLGRVFRALGVVRRGQVHKVAKQDIERGFVGQTAPHMKEIVEEALDGILFIDEAYALTRGQGRDSGFGQDAIDTLTDEMEKRRDRLVVIAAGYPREMEQFLQSNPGLRARFPHHVSFEDYSGEELLEILRRMASRRGHHLAPAAQVRALEYLQAQREIRGRTFGNAREARNLLDKMVTRLAVRVVEGDEPDALTDETTILPADVPDPPGSPRRRTRPGRHSMDLVSKLEPSPREPLSLTDVRQAVAFISVRTDDGEPGSGSGFVVAPQGLLLTAYHVVEAVSGILVRLESDPDRELAAQLIGWDATADLAVLALPEGAYPWAPLAEPGYVPEQGEPICVLGYPLGEDLGREVSFTEGAVSSIRQSPQGVSMIQIPAAATYGSSGAPVFRRSDWRVVGILHGGVSQEIASGINFAISAQEVYKRFGSREATRLGRQPPPRAQPAVRPR